MLAKVCASFLLLAYVSPRKVAPATMTNDVAFPPLRELAKLCTCSLKASVG